MKRTLIILILLSLPVLGTYAQNINTADEDFDRYIVSLRNSGESASAYAVLYRAYETYLQVFDVSAPGTREHLRASDALVKLSEELRRASYFYTKQNDDRQTAKFVQAYVNISLLPGIEGMKLSSDYPVFTRLAATRYYNDKDFRMAARCFQANINYGDSEHLNSSISNMAACYQNLGDLTSAWNVLKRGLDIFPADQKMMVMAINILGKTKEDDNSLQKYIVQMLNVHPHDEALLNLQAQLYERRKNYVAAVETYNKLWSLKPRNLEIARHIAINNYNAAVTFVKQAESETRKKDVEANILQARKHFTEAAKVLEDVVTSDPLVLNYHYALANSYNYLGNSAALDKANKKIIALGGKAVSGQIQPRVMAYDDTRSSLARYDSDWASAGNGGSGAVPSAKNPVQTPEISTPTPKKMPEVKSDVDTNIPVARNSNDNTFAIIIANEDYSRVADVPNAHHDGEIFAKYCNRTLGIPENNIRTHYDVTYGDLLDAIEDMKQIAWVKQGHCNFILYYAGHGVPDEKTKKAYILPVDADGHNTRICYPLEDLYAECSGMGAQRTLVLLDACFSGATRKDNEMLMAARSVALDVEDEPVSGNVIVFSAVSADQTALAYEAKNHGLFTYFFLKKLQDSKGEATLQEISKYVTEQVALQSRLINHKDQIPCLTTGSGLEKTWKNIKLNK